MSVSGEKRYAYGTPVRFSWDGRTVSGIWVGKDRRRGYTDYRIRVAGRLETIGATSEAGRTVTRIPLSVLS